MQISEVRILTRLLAITGRKRTPRDQKQAVIRVAAMPTPDTIRSAKDEKHKTTAAALKKTISVMKTTHTASISFSATARVLLVLVNSLFKALASPISRA